MSSAPIDDVQEAQKVPLTQTKDMSWSLPSDPTEFLQHIAYQSQLLACLHWLGEFQVLACVPLGGSVPIKDVADLSGVPVTQLAHVIRFTATASFLREPRRGEVAHTTQSAAFVTDPSFLDAGIFLAQVSARSARKMAQNPGLPNMLSDSTAYSSAFETGQSFTSASGSPRLQREISAYLHCVVNETSDTANLLTQLEWRKLGNACVVEIRAARIHPASLVLTELHSTPRFTVQTYEELLDQDAATTVAATASTSSLNRLDRTPEEPSPKRIKPGITYQRRCMGSPQAVAAAIYVLRLERPRSTVLQRSILSEAQIVGELRAHLSVLRHNSNATLVLIGPLLPEPGAVDAKTEMVVRLRDLSLNQLTSERETEVGDLVDIIGGVYDEAGGLVVVNKLYSRNSSTVALVTRYETHAIARGR